MASSSKSKKGVVPLPTNRVLTHTTEESSALRDTSLSNSLVSNCSDMSDGVEVNEEKPECFLSEEVSNVLLFPGHPATRIQITVQNALKRVSNRVRDILRSSFEFSVPLPSDGGTHFSTALKTKELSRREQECLGKFFNGATSDRSVSDEPPFTDEDLDSALRALRGHQVEQRED